MKKPYVFPGYTHFLRLAADRLERVPARGPARPGSLPAIGNLCAQATLADPLRAHEILAAAQAMRDQIEVALTAADLMIAEVSRAVEYPGLSARRPGGPNSPAGPAPLATAVAARPQAARPQAARPPHPSRPRS